MARVIICVILFKFMKKILFVFVPFLLFAIPIYFFLIKGESKGALQVTSVPKSDVYLSGKLIGQTPLCKCEGKDMIQIGEYNLRLVPKEGGFSPYEQKVVIGKSVLSVVDRTFDKEGEASGSTITLSPLSNKEIQVLALSFPEGAEVYMDNNLSGITPLLLKNITESDHELTFKKQGYKQKTLKIKTNPGFKLTALGFLGINLNAEIPSPVSSSPTPTVQIAKVLILQTPTGFLRVRESNSLSSAEIGRVNPGESFELVSEESGWFQIKLTDAKVGWVSSQYAQKE